MMETNSSRLNGCASLGYANVMLCIARRVFFGRETKEEKKTSRGSIIIGRLVSG